MLKSFCIYLGQFLLLLISEELELFHLPEALTYASGFSLAFLHIYNRKYCQCADESVA
ncbi:MAG: hypothetical protein CM15mP75_3600 [Flammeovirgaceae bacterium]|nr:MAG: hypothetical protein CM15mP75_3600 [Flammeovirgaceae bacterium]